MKRSGRTHCIELSNTPILTSDDLRARETKEREARLSYVSLSQGFASIKKMDIESYSTLKLAHEVKIFQIKSFTETTTHSLNVGRNIPRTPGPGQLKRGEQKTRGPILRNITTWIDGSDSNTM